MTVPYAAELRHACDAARLGGDRVMAFYGSLERQIQDGGSPVTAADHASSTAILDRIHELFPTDAILCEETADSQERLAGDRLWIVDPLDGTQEFLAQNGEFSVMIGLVERGRPVVGVVYQPAVETMYYAAARQVRGCCGTAPRCACGASSRSTPSEW